MFLRPTSASSLCSLNTLLAAPCAIQHPKFYPVCRRYIHHGRQDLKVTSATPSSSESPSAEPSRAQTSVNVNSPAGSLSTVCISDKCTLLYASALELARLEEYEAARKLFETLTKRYPQTCKAWVSWAQAWGLMELQRGNVFAAVRLLERCVKLDPKLQPVLKWKSIRTARLTVGSRRRSRQS